MQVALEDVNAIAAGVVEKLLASSAATNNFPDAERVVPELNQTDIRERFVYRYCLIIGMKLRAFWLRQLFTANACLATLLPAGLVNLA